MKSTIPYIVYIIILCILLCLFLFKLKYIDIDIDTLITVNRNELNDFINSYNNTVTNIYYINIDKSIDRNNRFLSRLYPTINPLRISAITPLTSPKIKKSYFYNSCTNTEYACTLSHLKAIYTAYINNDDYAIIMEDDAIMLRNFDWNKLINLAPNNWEILQLHTVCVPNTTSTYHPILKYNNTNKLWLKSNKFIASCACYIISKKGMEKLIFKYLKNIDKFTINTYFNKKNTIDWRYIDTLCMADAFIYHNLNRYICTQILIDTENIDSNIRDMSHPHSTCHIHSKNFIKNNFTINN
jgi:GR25 family glycosyltransferase involved in LPS biosynthesis